MTLALISTHGSQFGQLVTFGTIGLAGLIVLSFSALFGGHGHGALDTAGHHGGGDDVVSVFSPRILAVFCVGFGAAGTIAAVLGADVFISAFSGAGSGLVLAAMAFFALSYMHKQQANSLVASDAVVGRAGRVTTAIPSQGVGEVGVTVQQQYGTHMARSKDGNAIPSGQVVKVLGRTGGVLEVERG